MSKKPNVRINKVYTRTGDSGKTNLIDKKNLLKSDLRIMCYGEVDELNSNLVLFQIHLANQSFQIFYHLVLIHQLSLNHNLQNIWFNYFFRRN